jgi:hypothetical protein
VAPIIGAKISNDWPHAAGGRRPESPWYADETFYAEPDFAIQIVHDGEIDATPTSKNIARVDFDRGMDVMQEKYPQHWADIINESDDANTADVFLQCVVFGEVIYG